MSNKSENLIPNEYWNELSQNEINAIHDAANEMNQYLDEPALEWDEMNEVYYQHLRERFGKSKDEIGPRQFKQFQNSYIPLQIIVIPAGRQHNGENMVQYFHTIIEDLEDGECNGIYELITEEDLEKKFNIKYNN
jgi:hypothetical protein